MKIKASIFPVLKNRTFEVTAIASTKTSMRFFYLPEKIYVGYAIN